MVEPARSVEKAVRTVPLGRRSLKRMYHCFAAAVGSYKESVASPGRAVAPVDR